MLAGETKVRAHPKQVREEARTEQRSQGRRLQPKGGNPAHASGGKEGRKDLLKLPHLSSEQELGEQGKGDTSITMRSLELGFVQASSGSPSRTWPQGPRMGLSSLPLK